MKKQTAMKDLREDLVTSIDSAKDALLEIENKETRMACEVVVMIVLRNVIKRIDDELLETEKQQIIDAYKADLHPCSDEDAEQYYTETFNN
jgi:hypothetical protein